MDGVATIRQLLATDSAVTALVPATRVIAGTLPQGVTLPAISIISVSATDRNIPAPGMTRHVTERVQVTVVAPDYPALRNLHRKVKSACFAKMPLVSGIANVTVQTDAAGPDVFDAEAAICFKTQDFMVGFNEPA